jgi:Fe-S-cluster-containing hydrogenase component 2
MDIKKVGDSECIQCGECMSVCPTKAIVWKGSELFVRSNDANTPATTEIKPLIGLLKRDNNEEISEQASEEAAIETVAQEGDEDGKQS